MVPTVPKPRRVLLAVTLATVVIFGALVAILTLRLRRELRAEVLRREAEAVHAVALMQLRLAEERVGSLEAAGGLDAAFDAVLESSKLRGVFGVHVFDPAGTLYDGLPVTPRGEAIPPWWRGMPARPEARFLPHASVEAVLGLGVEPGSATTRAPVLDIAVPLQSERAGAVGVARYWSDGEPVAQEFRRMDRRLRLQAGVAFLSGAALVAAVLAWAFGRIADANRRLLEQSADLARANEELDFAAKTGALGAISAHLIHGLKNPLAGLEGFVAETATAGPEALRGDACRSAMETTRRLRAIITEVTGVLRDEAEAADYTVPVAEIVEAARIRSSAAADQAGVRVQASAASDVSVSARSANLAGLVLANLVTNAIEAAPAGSTVSIEARIAAERAEFLVRDEGPGLPEGVRSALFRPVRSTKRGGGGVGLAISQRIARHAGGELTLVRSDATGTVFSLAVPVFRGAVNASSRSAG